MQFAHVAQRVLHRCDELATCSEESGRLTRTCLSPALREVHRRLATWVEAAGMRWRVDAVGNFLARYPADHEEGAPVLVIGSHLDTVPDAGRYDGTLGVLLGLALVEQLAGRCLPFAIELVGFVDEEGVRFDIPFLGSSSYVGAFVPEWLERRDWQGVTLGEALRAFGLDPARALGGGSLPPATLGYLEFHIEQGPILERADLPVGVVTAIVGITRARLTFRGQAAHAGTTPMAERRDALAGAAEFVLAVESAGRAAPGLVATVGELVVRPGASNVVPGEVTCSLDVRHQDDATRVQAVQALRQQAEAIAAARGLELDWHCVSETAATPLDPELTALLADAVASVGLPVYQLPSGAGHDAMVLARRVPAAMLFLRTPGGLSHHPAERVEFGDVVVALQVGAAFLERLAAARGGPRWTT